jgi:hypothetical protein
LAQFPDQGIIATSLILVLVWCRERCVEDGSEDGVDVSRLIDGMVGMVAERELDIFAAGLCDEER